MLKFFFITLGLMTPFASSYAFDASVRGFIALDMLSIQKQENRKQEVMTGIGTLDLKVYATHDDFSTKIKLDLDSGRIGDAYNIFEEATASYRFLPNHQLIMGKGKVPFHQMHWGVINSSITDGGTIFNTDHSMRDLDRKLVLSWRAGGFTSGYFNYLTFWGNSQQPEKNFDGSLRLTGAPSSHRITYRNEKTFSSKDEAGFANKFEWFFNRQLSASVAGMYYYNDINPKNNWALDLSSRYSDRDLEVWFEYVRAFISTHYAASYATMKKYEDLVQLGAEYYLTELYNVLANIEGVRVNNQRHFITGSSFNNGKKYETDTYKFEIGVKIKFQRSAYVTIGGQVERQDYAVATDDINKHEYAYQLKSGFSFWF